MILDSLIWENHVNSVNVQIHEHLIEILQNLIRINTTNPPGMFYKAFDVFNATPFVDRGCAGTIHAADERVPVDTLDFGAKALYSDIQKFH